MANPRNDSEDINDATTAVRISTMEDIVLRLEGYPEIIYDATTAVRISTMEDIVLRLKGLNKILITTAWKGIQSSKSPWHDYIAERHLDTLRHLTTELPRPLILYGKADVKELERHLAGELERGNQWTVVYQIILDYFSAGKAKHREKAHWFAQAENAGFETCLALIKAGTALAKEAIGMAFINGVTKRLKTLDELLNEVYCKISRSDVNDRMGFSHVLSRPWLAHSESMELRRLRLGSVAAQSRSLISKATKTEPSPLEEGSSTAVHTENPSGAVLLRGTRSKKTARIDHSATFAQQERKDKQRLSQRFERGDDDGDMTTPRTYRRPRRPSYVEPVPPLIEQSTTRFSSPPAGLYQTDITSPPPQTVPISVNFGQDSSTISYIAGPSTELSGPRRAGEYPSTRQKYDPTTFAVVIILTIAAATLTMQGWNASPHEIGKTGDADFWFLLQSSLMQLASLVPAIVLFSSNPIKSLQPRILNWAFLGAGTILSVLAPIAYCLLRTEYSAIIAFGGSVMQVLVVLEAMVIVSSVAKKKQ